MRDAKTLGAIAVGLVMAIAGCTSPSRREPEQRYYGASRVTVATEEG